MLGSMVDVPQLGRDEDVLALDHTFGDLGQHGSAHLRFVAIEVGRVKVAVAQVDGVFDHIFTLVVSGLKSDEQK